MKPALYLFVVLQLADIATTLIAFHLGAREANPLVAQFVMLGPFTGLLLEKLIAVALFFGLLWYQRTNESKGGWLLNVLNGAFYLIVVWNCHVIDHFHAAGLLV
jgi:hypothetical protein